MNAAAFVVRPHGGRFLVCRALPGTTLMVEPVADCLTLKSAELECAWQQAEFDRRQHVDREDARLRGLRGLPRSPFTYPLSVLRS